MAQRTGPENPDYSQLYIFSQIPANRRTASYSSTATATTLILHFRRFAC